MQLSIWSAFHHNETGRVEHCILKLDRKGKSAKSDEITRHNTVMRQVNA